MSNEEYLTAREVSTLLRCSYRQAHRLGELGKIRTIRSGNQTLFSAADAQKLANELNIDKKPRKSQPQYQILPPDEVLNYIRERDQQLAQVQKELQQAVLRIGMLQGELEASRRLIEDAQQARSRLEEVERERETLKEERDELQRRLDDLQRRLDSMVLHACKTCIACRATSDFA